MLASTSSSACAASNSSSRRFQAPGLDLRQVENVVDEFEQVQRVLVDMAQEPALLVRQRAPSISSRSSSEKPMMVCSGVRSSWLMLARKSLFEPVGALDFAVADFELLVRGRQLGSEAVVHGADLFFGASCAR